MSFPKSCLVLGRYISCLLFFANINFKNAQAQIIPDNTLGAESSTIRSIDQLRDAIEGGAVRGNNLFHSFTEFNVGKGRTVDFTNPEGISNIFSRVTGNNISEIFGTLGVDGTANLFLMNSNGIVFGENAAINIGGSFIATTADTIDFNDGEEFSAVAPNEPLLTIDFPVGLGMGSNNGSIIVNGTGNQIVDDSGLAPAVVFGQIPSGISVNDGQTLALIGNGININGGVLTSEGGQVFLNSVESGSVGITQAKNKVTFLDSDVNKYQDINLDQQSLIDASSEKVGIISVNGANINLLDGSFILSRSQGNSSGNLIDIKASESINLLGTSPDGNISSNIRSETLDNGLGASINISAGQLLLNNIARINTITSGNAKGGDININVSSTSQLNQGIVSALSFGKGNTGNINFSTSRLQLNNTGIITSSSLGEGNGGRTIVNADLLEINGGMFADPSNISSSSFGTGEGGIVEVNAKQLSLTDGGLISSSSFGDSNAGNLTVKTSESVDISGATNQGREGSGIISLVVPASETARQALKLPENPTGNAGNLTVNTPVLNLSKDGLISVENRGTGNGGVVTLNVNNLNLDEAVSITATAESGEGGNIVLSSDNLSLRNQSQISASAGGSGNGGNITIDSNTILGLENSDITANAFRGNGGNIIIDSDFIVGLEERSQLTNLSDITASSEFGTDGTVEVNTPDNNLGDDAIAVFKIYDAPETKELLERRCLNPRNPKEKIINVGRAGVPANPDNFFDDEEIVRIEGVGEPRGVNEEPTDWIEGDPIVEPNAVKVGADGETYLVSETPVSQTQLEDADLGICTRSAKD